MYHCNTIKFLLVFLCLVVGSGSFAQSEIEAPLKDQFDYVSMNWLGKSERLKTYSGIDEYCQSHDFRGSVNDLLSEIHAYDSMIVAKLNDPLSYLNLNAKEERKTLSDIQSLESEYGTAAFIEKMREACVFRNEIEQNAEDLRNGVGYESYDAKVMVLETDMIRYLKKIDKLVFKVDDHLHVLDVN